MTESAVSSLLAVDVCADCVGTGVDTDDDGSVSGNVGASIPCGCTLSPVAPAPRLVVTTSLAGWDVGVTQTPTPCMSCGAATDNWGWLRRGDAGVLMRDVDSDPYPCPDGRGFDWETGEGVPVVEHSAVAA